MARTRRAAPEPLQIDAGRVILAGTAVWFVAFLVLLALSGRLAAAGELVWLWTCLAGWVLGLLGWLLARRQQGR